MSKYDTGEMAGACHSCYVISALCALLSYILYVTCSQQIGETAETTWYHECLKNFLFKSLCPFFHMKNVTESVTILTANNKYTHSSIYIAVKYKLSVQQVHIGTYLPTQKEKKCLAKVFSPTLDPSKCGNVHNMWCPFW